jgi:hypothetical protein
MSHEKLIIIGTAVLTASIILFIIWIGIRSARKWHHKHSHTDDWLEYYDDPAKSYLDDEHKLF